MNKVILTISLNTKCKINPLDPIIGQKLLQLTEDGLLFDFSQVIQKDGFNIIIIPVYTIGKFTDMDAMYNDLAKHKANASNRMHLVYCSERWLFE